MARNEEKAQSLLNRWTSMKQDFSDTFKNRRPYLASQCDNIKDAERWRRQIIREISKKVADIQNAGSGEHVIRDLNDEINKRMREKRHWEKRIVELGGPDYSRSQPQAYDADGSSVQGGGGYKYFGAAKNLPGVRELFQKEERAPKKRSRQDMFKNIEPDYYGFRDEEDDSQLLQEEQEVEAALQKATIEEWNRAEAERKAQVAALHNILLQSRMRDADVNRRNARHANYRRRKGRGEGRRTSVTEEGEGRVRERDGAAEGGADGLALWQVLDHSVKRHDESVVAVCVAWGLSKRFRMTRLPLAAPFRSPIVVAKTRTQRRNPVQK
ncbi:Pre-mrna-splicing factor isy1, partial [Globisporangium splendens]